MNPPDARQSCRRRSRPEKVSETLAREILRDVIRRAPEGAKLESEAAMIERYGVSRASLREALRILEVHGLIDVKPGRNGGPVVRAVTGEDYGRTSTLFFEAVEATYSELLEARLAIDPLMARLAAERRDPDRVAELQGAVSAKVDLAVDREYLSHALSFHGLVAHMSGNRILDLYGSALETMYVERVTRFLFPADDREHVQQAHQGIADAIADGDGDLAENRMRAHMNRFARYATQQVPSLLDDVIEWN